MARRQLGGHADPVDPRVESLLSLFVREQVGGEVEVGIRRGAGKSAYWEVHTEVRGVVTRVDLDQGIVECQIWGQAAQLHFDEKALLQLLEGAGEGWELVWGESLPDEEAAARSLLLSLEGALDTPDAHPSGWWSYGTDGFLPLPPWEAYAARRRGQ